ncbi:hypothetical protein [Thermoactinomyces vulgaris]|jgi:hypothetical protein|uniref:hypothetical protein n=1 Tax=Thermoactinomyces vulgaris TaxID=2026 RepID=UPI00362CD925
MDFEIDATEFFVKIDRIDARVTKAAHNAVEKSVQDLETIATNIAPIDTSTLRRSASSRVVDRGNRFSRQVIGEVGFSATEYSPGYGAFNYAIWTHEYTYNLGPQSRAAGGYAGYPVGNKYLTRPLRGEAKKYHRWWSDAIREATK